MRMDTQKLCIAVCGPLPGTVERLHRRKDVELTAFSNGGALMERIEDDAPFDFMVIQSDAGGEMFPLYYPGCEGNCLVYLMANPQSAEDMEGLNEMIDTLLDEKQRKMGLRVQPHTTI